MKTPAATNSADTIAALIADTDPNDCVVPTYLIRELLASERSAPSPPNQNDNEHARRANAANDVVDHCRMVLTAASASPDADMLAETIIEWLTEHTDR